MAGSPRWLVCSRCATWWPFARAVCPTCGEDDSRKLAAYAVEDLEPARIDACDTCRAYIKSFDLRRPGGRDAVPLVDDVATLALDLWAHEQGLHRRARSRRSLNGSQLLLRGPATDAMAPSSRLPSGRDP